VEGGLSNHEIHERNEKVLGLGWGICEPRIFTNGHEF
jgi:hypothetical protein